MITTLEKKIQMNKICCKKKKSMKINNEKLSWKDGWIKIKT